MKQRLYQIDHAVLARVLSIAGHDGYPTSITELANDVRQSVPDLIYNAELVEALKRLSYEGRLRLLKWSVEERRFLLYPSEIADDNKCFHIGDFKIEPTSEAHAYFDQLSFALGEEKPEPLRHRIGFVR